MFIFGILVAGATPAYAADRAIADFVVIGVDEVVVEDVYAVGNSVDVRGTIDGDLIAFAGGEVHVGGIVTGDVIAVSGSVVIDGTVEGSVRATAGSVTVNGTVGRDVVVAAGRTVVMGQIHRDLLAWGWSLNLAGVVDGFVWGQTLGTTRISGDIGHDFEMTVGGLEILAGTSVVGDLGYRSPDPATVDPLAEVGGQLIQREDTRQNIRLRAVVLVGAVLGILVFVVGGLSLFWATPRSLENAVEAVRLAWGRAALTGLGVLMIPFTVPAVVVAIASSADPDVALPLALALTPVAIGVGGVFALAVIVAPVPVLTSVGQRLAKNHSALFGFVVGAGLFILLTLVPVLRWVALFAVVVVGLGSWVLGALAARGSTEWQDRPLLTDSDR